MLEGPTPIACGYYRQYGIIGCEDKKVYRSPDTKDSYLLGAKLLSGAKSLPQNRYNNL